MTAAFRIDAADNVATLLADAAAQDAVGVRGGDAPVIAREPVALGHKIALADIAAGGPVTKFGIAIGVATAPILRGDWVHLHNCASGYDERSGGFDIVTGAAADMRYD